MPWAPSAPRPASNPANTMKFTVADLLDQLPASEPLPLARLE
jgi:hypothetical protein